MRVFKKAGARVFAHESLHKFLSHRQLPLFRTLYATYKPFIIDVMVKKASYTKKEAENILGEVRLSPPDEEFT